MDSDVALPSNRRTYGALEICRAPVLSTGPEHGLSGFGEQKKSGFKEYHIFPPHMNQVGKTKLVEIFEADLEAGGEIADDAGTRKSILPNLKKTESWTAFWIWDQIQMNSFTNLDLFIQILWLKSKKNEIGNLCKHQDQDMHLYQAELYTFKYLYNIHVDIGMICLHMCKNACKCTK